MTFRGDYAQGQGGNVSTSSGSGQGGGGGLPSGAMMLLPLLLRGGGGGAVIVVLLALLYFSGAFNGILGGEDSSQTQSQSQGNYTLEHCQEPGSSNKYDDCRAAATWGSLNTIWEQVLPAQSDTQFTEPNMTIFKNDVNTGCGFASADTGPFYCPRDTTAYLDVSFFDDLGRLGGSNGPLAQEYATAHEYGHHIQNLEGTLGLSDYKNPGQDSAAVALELQADCYAGIWAHHASRGETRRLSPFLTSSCSRHCKRHSPSATTTFSAAPAARLTQMRGPTARPSSAWRRLSPGMNPAQCPRATPSTAACTRASL